MQRHRTAAFPDCKAIITSFLTQNYLCRAIGSTSGDMTTSLLRLRLLYQSSTIPPSAQKSNERATRKQSDTKPHHWSKLYFTENPVETRWYPRPDSNRHASRRGILSPLRLPISPPGHFLDEAHLIWNVYCTWKFDLSLLRGGPGGSKGVRSLEIGLTVPN